MTPGNLTSLLIIAFCVIGVLMIGRYQAAAAHHQGLRYWQPWRRWVIGIGGGLFVLLIGFLAVAGAGWLD